jgi:hypothetical protein
MEEIATSISSGYVHYYRSDIRDFFTHIPRSAVVGQVGRIVRDPALRRLFADGLATNLANLDELSVEERALFPLGRVGVAQGSPLSAFAGNLLLGGLDERANAAGARFIRYIDDLLVLAKSESEANRSFGEVKSELEAMGFSTYSVGEPNSKARRGKVTESFVFLGTLVTVGLLQPARENRSALLERVEAILADGGRRLRRSARQDKGTVEGGVVRILWRLDNQIRGTARAFRHCDCPQLWRALDAKIDRQIRDLLGLYSRLRNGTDDVQRKRRLLGVAPLVDLNGVSWRELMSKQRAPKQASG